MKKQYQYPKMNLVEIEEWQSVVCTSSEDEFTVKISGYGEQSENTGFNPSSGAPRRNGPWDE